MRRLVSSKPTKQCSSSLGFMFSHGFRARSQPGHHIAIIDFVRSRIDKKHAGLLVVLDHLRRKRNTAVYDDTGFVSHHDAEQALESAGDYLNVIRVDNRSPNALKQSCTFFRDMLSMGAQDTASEASGSRAPVSS